MGVVFTTLFALGALLLEQSDASAVHPDVEHALYGNLESLIWLNATGWRSLVDPAALAGLPPQVLRLFNVFLLVCTFLTALWKELVVSTFDPVFVDSIGEIVASSGGSISGARASPAPRSRQRAA